jgi:hypothetical protein
VNYPRKPWHGVVERVSIRPLAFSSLMGMIVGRCMFTRNGAPVRVYLMSRRFVARHSPTEYPLDAVSLRFGVSRMFADSFFHRRSTHPKFRFFYGMAVTP